MDDDFDLSLSPAKKKSPSKGRRAESSITRKDSSTETSFRQASNDDDLGLGDLSLADDILNTSLNGSSGAVLRKARKAGVWTHSYPSSQQVDSRRTSLFASSFDDEAFKVDANVNAEAFEPEEPSTVDIPVIPDLDDVQDEEFAAQVAVAPRVNVNRVSSYNELDVDLLKHSSFTTVNSVDLRFLARFLSPEANIMENDAARTWEMLFTDVSSALAADQPDDEDTEPEES